MRLAFITDTPAVSQPAQRYIASVVDAVRDAANSNFEYELIPAVSVDQPDRKVPSIKLLRDERESLLGRVAAYAPDAVVTLGAAALNGWEGPAKPLTLRKQHGRMRLVEGISTTPTVDAWRVIVSPDLHRDFARVVYKAVTQPEPLPPMGVELVVCRSIEDLRVSVAALEGASVIGVDVETTGLAPYREDMLAIGLGAVYDDEAGLAIIVPSELLLEPETGIILESVIWRVGRRSVGHNFKFDMQFLQKQVGWMPEGASIGDTLLLAHLLDERPNRPTSRARGSGLKDLVAQRYDYEYGFDFTGPVENFDALYAYLGDDVVYTARMWLDMEAEALAESPRLLQCHDDLLREVSRVIARAEYSGAPVDLRWVYDAIDVADARATRRRAALEREIVKLAPTMAIANILAPQQVADVMYDEWGMTPDVRRKGKIGSERSTDADHIKAAVSKYRSAQYRGTPLWRQAGWLQSLVRLRKDIRLSTTYQKSIVDRTDDDGRVRASFLLHGASTGRISSAEPNLQNVPAVDERREVRPGVWEYKLRDQSWTRRPMRQAFQAPEGYQWVEVDYSQLELRVAAGISGDQAFIDVFRSGRDIHREVAAAIFSKPAADVSKGERFLAKAVSFGIIYGRSAKALAEGAEMDQFERDGGSRWTVEQASAFIRKFLHSYPDLERWITKTHLEAPVNGYVESPEGRRRRFPLVTDRELGAIQRQAVNTPIQAQASDICLRAMVQVQDRIDADGLDASVLFPVHDSICLEVVQHQVKDLEDICREIMEVDFMGCPLTVDFEYGPNWADVTAHG